MFTPGATAPANYEALAIWKCDKRKACPMEQEIESLSMKGVRSVGGCSDGLGAELSQGTVRLASPAQDTSHGHGNGRTVRMLFQDECA